MLCPCSTSVWLGTGSFLLEGFGQIPLSSRDLVDFVFLPLTPNPGGSGCFWVCAVWLQFAFCRKEFSDQVRLALHRGSLARGTAGPFAKKKGFCCIEARFSWKVSMKIAGKPFPAILGKFAASIFFFL